MARPDFVMSMYASKADLYKAKAEYFEKALEKLRDDMIYERDSAANPGPYMDPEDYAQADGKEFAYDAVVYALNKIL